MNAAELLNAVKQHAGFTITGARDHKARAAADIKSHFEDGARWTIVNERHSDDSYFEFRTIFLEERICPGNVQGARQELVAGSC